MRVERGEREAASTARLLVEHTLSLSLSLYTLLLPWPLGPRPNRVVINYQSNYLMI